jgi:hypothetical protein
MNGVPDENDIVYNTYGIDFVGLFRFLYEKLIENDWQAFMAGVSFWWNVYSVFAILLALLFFAGFVYAKIRFSQLSEIEQDALKREEARWAEKYGGVRSENDRWSTIQDHLIKEDPTAWRIAIIEADIFLEEVLTNAGYVGNTIGDKLKSANTTSFSTLQDAWEAHKVRNEIAHAGSDFILTKKMAQETLVRFERVFREFGAI